MNGAVRDILEIASLIIGVSLVGLLVTNSSGTAKVIDALSGGFSSVLKTATFQGGFGNLGSPNNFAG